MRNECNIIRDLLPLYAENMVTPDTADFVEKHLKDCEACRKEYEKTKEPQSVQELPNATPLLKLSQKLKIKKIQTIALTALFVTALLVSFFAVLDAPIYLPYSEEIITIEELDSKGILLIFDEEVTDFKYTVYKDPDGGDFYYCDIEAWTSLWDKWFSRRKGNLTAAVTAEHTKPIIAVYIPNDGTENVCIAKYDPNTENKIEENVYYQNTIILPRLALGFYLILAIAALAVIGIIRFLARKKTQVRIWTERVGLYPAAYIISHYIVSGMNWTSYSLPRNFSLIILISILLYSGLLLACSLWRLKREIKEINC